MIRTFQSKALDRFWSRGQTGAVSADHRRRIALVLNALEAGRRPEDLDIPGFRLHRLSGDLSDFWSVRVSANWRIIFRFDGDDAVEVDLVDYH